MKAYILFGKRNAHPWAGMLNPKYRHVWCILADNRANTWISYDWDQGLPRVKVQAALDFDIKSHYEEQGWEVIDMADHKREVAEGLFTLNNCVGHVKNVLGIGGFDWTPYQLYKRITGQKRIWHWPTGSWYTVPGFGGGGGGGGVALPPDPAHEAAKDPVPDDTSGLTDEEKRRRAASGGNDDDGDFDSGLGDDDDDGSGDPGDTGSGGFA